MERINFCEPTFASRLREIRESGLVLMRRRSARVTACALTVAIIFGTAEASRVCGALGSATQIEAQRDELAARARLVEAAARSEQARQAALLTGLRLRRSNAELAADVARLGNALGPSISLVALRGREDSIDVEGRGRSFSDVRLALRHVSAGIHERVKDGTLTFEVRRDDRMVRYVSFRLALFPTTHAGGPH